MLQAFFRTIPQELEEAAALDGATRLGIIVRILLPLAAPGVAAIAIFAFITSWTEYIFSSILIVSEANRTVPVGLAGIIGQYQVDWGLLLAGATATALPVLVLFGLVGRNFVEGLTAGAVR
jgi:ABC-type glycerol-3-phosphate transport system permease component